MHLHIYIIRTQRNLVDLEACKTTCTGVVYVDPVACMLRGLQLNNTLVDLLYGSLQYFVLS